MFANVSALVNAKWYLGIPFNDTAHPRLQIAELGEKIIGKNLLGFQLGNEPDLYVSCVPLCVSPSSLLLSIAATWKGH